MMLASDLTGMFSASLAKKNENSYFKRNSAKIIRS
jgi:hypothetical protein